MAKNTRKNRRSSRRSTRKSQRGGDGSKKAQSQKPQTPKPCQHTWKRTNPKNASGHMTCTKCGAGKYP